jgi:Aldehyde dehydrogenase family
VKLADPILLKSQCLIDGKWVGDSARPIANPATGEIMAKIPRFGEAETVDAIGAAQKVFGPWAKALPKERAQILRRWFDLIRRQCRERAVRTDSAPTNRPADWERSPKRYRARHHQCDADRNCSQRVHRQRRARSPIDAPLDSDVLASTPRDHPGRPRTIRACDANKGARWFRQSSPSGIVTPRWACCPTRGRITERMKNQLQRISFPA